MRGGTLAAAHVLVLPALFQSTHPVRGGTKRSAAWSPAAKHFNPPTPCGVGPSGQTKRASPKHFNPPTPCGVGRKVTDHIITGDGISIHPPRAGWDWWTCSSVSEAGKFQSTHPVRGGTSQPTGTRPVPQFQSTHPVRGGTRQSICSYGVRYHFNPPTPCGVGHCGCAALDDESYISIHPPRAGWDRASFLTCSS